MQITQNQLKKLIDYCETTGEFTWKERPPELFKTKRALSTWNARYAGKRAGSVNKVSGYVEITVMDVFFYGHRLAWIYVYGEAPDCDIDHINHIRHDNRLCNLRMATDEQNQQNQKLSKSSSSGHTGVNWSSRKNSWIVQACHSGKRIYGGQFKNIADAVEKRAEINASLGFHENHGVTF